MAMQLSVLKLYPICVQKRHRICNLSKLVSKIKHQGIKQPNPYSSNGSSAVRQNPKPSFPQNNNKNNNNNCTINDDSAMNSVEESDVGITCFISNLPGFRGILKQRYMCCGSIKQDIYDYIVCLFVCVLLESVVVQLSKDIYKCSVCEIRNC